MALGGTQLVLRWSSEALDLLNAHDLFTAWAFNDHFAFRFRCEVEKPFPTKGQFDFSIGLSKGIAPTDNLTLDKSD